MNIRKIFNYSPNFNTKKRKTCQIKFIVFHYTGMKKESEAVNRLTDIQSEVSSHYLIKNNGEVVVMVPDLYIAWHAGKSSWKSFKSLKKHSIGIEISNPGHSSDYKKFSKKQTQSIMKLSKYLIKKYKIELKNILGHSDISPNRKKDPGENFPWKYLANQKIGLWHSISDKVLKKSRMLKINQINQKYFYNNLSKIGYCTKNLENMQNNRFLNLIVKAFQRRFRQELINGKIDKECLLISENLTKKFN